MTLTLAYSLILVTIITGGACICIYFAFVKRQAKKTIKHCIEREGYIERFNGIDIQMRGENWINEYIKSIQVPSIFQQRELAALTRIIHEPDYMKDIPWKFLYFDKKYEGGMPHTHGPYIMLPTDTNITPKTLIHEKTHIFQRLFPCKAIKMVGMQITGFVYPRDGHRANPDTNRILFSDIRPKWATNASKLNHIDDFRDHPYEIMAYESLY